MNNLIRFLWGLAGLVSFLLGLLTGGLYLGYLNVRGTFWQNLSNDPVAGAVASLFILLAIIIWLVTGVKRPSIKPESRSIVQFNEMGEVRVSFSAVENMVLRVSRQIKGIRETETRVLYTAQGLDIFLKVKVLPDIQIPALTSELQTKVKEYIEDITGAAVAEVKVLVENIIVDHISSRK